MIGCYVFFYDDFAKIARKCEIGCIGRGNSEKSFGKGMSCSQILMLKFFPGTHSSEHIGLGRLFREIPMPE